jgi:hypothetical protein
MKRISIVAAAALVLAVSACGSDSDSADLSDAQAAAAQSAIDSAAEDGVTLEESCVNDVAAQLSEDDAALAAADADAELSTAGEALGIELLSCADSDEIIDLFIASLSEGGQPFDEACARETLEDFGVTELVESAGADGPPAELIDALTECLDG